MRSLDITFESLEAEHCAELDGYTELRIVWSANGGGGTEWLENTQANRKRLAAVMDDDTEYRRRNCG